MADGGQITGGPTVAGQDTSCPFPGPAQLVGEADQEARHALISSSSPAADQTARRPARTPSPAPPAVRDLHPPPDSPCRPSWLGRPSGSTSSAADDVGADAPSAPQRAYPLPAIRRLAALARRPSARSGLPLLVDSPDVPAPVGRRQQVGGPELLVETHPRQLVRQRAAGHRRPNLPLRSLFRFTRSLLRPPPFIANFLSYIHFNLFQWLFEDFLKGAACETPGAGGLAQSSILLVNTHSPWIADWMPAPEDRRHAERWK